MITRKQLKNNNDLILDTAAQQHVFNRIWPTAININTDYKTKLNMGGFEEHKEISQGCWDSGFVKQALVLPTIGYNLIVGGKLILDMTTITYQSTLPIKDV